MHNPGLTRAWGDGAGSVKPHVIATISFEEGRTQCSCGTTVHSARGLTLEDAWDIHRGRTDLVTDRVLTPVHEAQASDSEVQEFLGLVSNPTYEFDA